MFQHIPATDLPQQWGRISALIAPAVAVDPTGITLDQVLEKLLAGRCQCVEVETPVGGGVFVFEIFEDDEQVKCFSSYIAGHLDLGPKAWLRAMRAMMDEFETLIAEAGCVENYIGGRDWSRVFPDYLPTDGVPNRLKKVLAHG